MDPRCRTVVLGFASFLFVMKGALAQLPAGKLIQGAQIAGPKTESQNSLH